RPSGPARSRPSPWKTGPTQSVLPPSARYGYASAGRQWDHSCSCCLLLPGLPAGLGDTRDVAIESQFADLGPSQTELTEGAARATGDFTAVALTGRIGVTRELLQTQAGGSALFVALLRVVGDRLQFRVLGGVLC